MSRHPLAFPHARRKRRRADRTRSAVEHRSVRCAAATKMVSLHKTGEPPALARRYDMDAFLRAEDIAHHSVAGIEVVFTFLAQFTQHANRSDVRLFKMAVHRLRDSLRLDEF